MFVKIGHNIINCEMIKYIKISYKWGWAQVFLKDSDYLMIEHLDDKQLDYMFNMLCNKVVK